MKQIKASEVKPGMTIQWFDLGVKSTCVVSSIEPSGNRMFQEIMAQGGGEATLDNNAPVTVLSEPTPPQPEEPRWVAARVKVGDRRFFRVDDSDRPWRKADHKGKVIPFRYSWSDICSSDTVTVIPDQGWTVLDTPAVPERIEEWPEDDTALRKHEWRDSSGRFWQSLGEGDWRFEVGPDTWSFSYPRPYRGPWTRETDA